MAIPIPVSVQPRTGVAGFRKLLFDFAAKLVELPAQDLRKEINRGIDEMGRYGPFSQIVLAEIHPVERTYHMMYAYTALGFQAGIPGFFTDKSAFPPLQHDNATEALSNKQFSDGHLWDGGDTRELAIPIQTEDEKRYALVFASEDKELFTGELIEHLLYGANILKSALNRFHSADTLLDLERFEQHLSEISASYINLSAKRLEKVLTNDFSRLNRLLGVDVCILYLVDENDESFFVAKPLIWFLDETQPANRALIEWLKDNPTLDSKNYRYIFDQWHQGKPIVWSTPEDIPEEGQISKQLHIALGVKSSVIVPIMFAGSIKGTMNIATTRQYRTWSEDIIPRLRLFGEVFINAIMRKQSEIKLKNAFSEIKRLKKLAESDYTYLRKEIDLEFKSAIYDVVGKSGALSSILTKAKQVATTPSTVLILGETGTGKGIIARAIHNLSTCKDRPLVQINCAALAPSLIESELFGHEKGAFTGAAARRLGRFEEANGTTLFLDEIGDLPLALQSKLLRVIEDGEFQRVGGNKTVKTDARLIAATSKDLENEMAEGKFRQDLWYRLNVFPILVPPLRERLEDIPLLVAHFSKQFGNREGKEFKALPLKTMRALQAYSWPGNIRELKNVIERSVITSSGQNLNVEIPSTDF